MKHFAAMACVALATLGLGSSVQAASYDHIDRLAIKLQGQSRRFLEETSIHYRHTPQYGHLYRDAREMYGLAAHVHEVAHHHGSARHLKSDLDELDRLYHHVEDMVRHMRGCDLSHVRRSLRDMGDTLHHLRDDINELVRGDDHHHEPEIGHGGHGHHSRRGDYGTRFSGRGWSIRFGR